MSINCPKGTPGLCLARLSAARHFYFWWYVRRAVSRIKTAIRGAYAVTRSRPAGTCNLGGRYRREVPLRKITDVYDDSCSLGVIKVNFQHPRTNRQLKIPLFAGSH